MYSHVVTYPTPSNITYAWNLGFLLFMSMVIQVVSGVLLTAVFFNNEVMSSFDQVYSLIFDFNYGYILRYTHSTYASVVMFILFLHILKSYSVRSWTTNSSLYSSGMVIYVILMATCFLGYVLTCGQLSYWGTSVITNMLKSITCLYEWVLGNFYVSSVVISRFLCYHYLLAFVSLALSIVHFAYLHKMGSSSVRNGTTQRSVFPIFIIKDLGTLFIKLSATTLMITLGLIQLSHTDNCLTIDPLVTPSHIVPEWYFLQVYALLKCVPNKTMGVLLLVCYIIIVSININTYSGFSVFRAVLIVTVNLTLFLLGAMLPTDMYVASSRVMCGLLFYLTLLPSLYTNHHHHHTLI